MTTTFTDWDTAIAAAFAADKRIGGTLLKTGEPVYFLHDSDATDETMRDLTFLIREGRKRTDFEKQLMELAEAQR